jgi:hypothetical protein
MGRARVPYQQGMTRSARPRARRSGSPRHTGPGERRGEEWWVATREVGGGAGKGWLDLVGAAAEGRRNRREGRNGGVRGMGEEGREGSPVVESEGVGCVHYYYNGRDGRSQIHLHHLYEGISLYKGWPALPKPTVRPETTTPSSFSGRKQKILGLQSAVGPPDVWDRPHLSVASSCSSGPLRFLLSSSPLAQQVRGNDSFQAH